MKPAARCQRPWCAEMDQKLEPQSKPADRSESGCSSDMQRLQSWMQSVLIQRGDLHQKLRSAHHKTGLDLADTLRETAELSALDRINIYTSGYIARLVACLKAEYPLLQKFMGEDVFDGFAKAYIVTLPSSHYSLYELGSGFSAFLAETQPTGHNEPDQQTLFEIPAQLARFERTQAELILAKGLEEVEEHKLVPNTPLPLASENLVLQVSPCLRVLEFTYPILEFIGSLKSEEQIKQPKRDTCWIALSRKNYRPTCFNLANWQVDFLAGCRQATTISEVLQSMEISTDVLRGTMRAEALLWVPTALHLGLLHCPISAAGPALKSI